uniref:Uncharacterized protein n=1 Tax=Anabas testudineus TaxID=64144 RepID=A0A3Q1HL58_ANATE
MFSLNSLLLNALCPHTQNSGCKQMAERALFERYLSCHVCSETFRDPVSLSCKHSFCSSCLQQFWKDAKIKDCPVCKRKSSKDRPSINLSLKELADSFTKRKNNKITCWFFWENMKDKVHFSPVILDPNTASGWLHLSDDMTSVRQGDTKQQLPDNPERNMKYTTVFGSESFSSGKHSWEVEVGDHPRWIVGLVKESVDKKVESISPEYGIWCLSHDSGEYTDVVCETVTVKKSLKRIRVQLDYDRGEVSFYDPENKTQICTHRETFIENIFPYFSLGEAGNSKTSKIKICPSEICLSGVVHPLWL